MQNRTTLLGLALAGLLALAAPSAAQDNCLDASDGDPECAVFVDADGDVGVGTETPSARLDVTFANSSATSPAIAIDNSVTSGQNVLEFQFGGTTHTRLRTAHGGDLFAGTTGNSAMNLLTNNSIRMKITGGGDVGIGTLAAEAPLDVRGGVYFEGGGGNVDGDGNLDIIDLAEVLDIITGASEPTPGEFAEADINGDGKVSFDDVGILVRMLQGSDKEDAVLGIGGRYGMVDTDTFLVSADVDILGTLDVDGPIFQRGEELHADYVFEPGYELESIEEHAEFMWREKHLEAVPPRRLDATGGEVVEIGAQRRGILEELEKAHIYIARLNERIERQAEALADLETLRGQVERLEAALAGSVADAGGDPGR